MNEINYQDMFFNIERFKLATKNIVHGFITGRHQSPFHGFSVEFSDHRPYNSGDSTQFIDWKLYAKTDKYYIKRYQDETNVRVYIIIDHSRSMMFSTTKTNDKLYQSKLIASTIAYMALKQKDAVGLYTVNKQITSNLPAKAKINWLDQILQNLNKFDGSGTTDFSECLHEIADKTKKRNLIIMISDYLDDSDSIISAMKHFKYNMNDLILVQVNDPIELDLDYRGTLEIHDIETDESLNVNASEIKNEYIKHIDNHYHKIKESCLKLNFDYIDFKTTDDFSKILSSYMYKRNTMI